jgi:hypothetical protein
LTLSAVVKYGLPRFFGITKTFNPVLRDVAAVAAVSTIAPRRQTAPIDVRCFVRVRFTCVSFRLLKRLLGSWARPPQRMRATAKTG